MELVIRAPPVCAASDTRKGEGEYPWGHEGARGRGALHCGLPDREYASVPEISPRGPGHAAVETHRRGLFCTRVEGSHLMFDMPRLRSLRRSHADASPLVGAADGLETSVDTGTASLALPSHALLLEVDQRGVIVRDGADRQLLRRLWQARAGERVNDVPERLGPEHGRGGGGGRAPNVPSASLTSAHALACAL